MAAAQAVPMIDIPGYGTLAAEVVCTRLGIKNQHDSKKLAEAKAEVYLKGFTSGVMTVGNHKGVKVLLLYRCLRLARAITLHPTEQCVLL